MVKNLFRGGESLVKQLDDCIKRWVTDKGSLYYPQHFQKEDIGYD